MRFARATLATIAVAVGILALSRPVLGDDEPIRVRTVSFKGVQRVDESALRNALVTRSSSKLPWGTKRYFDRAQFDADLARIRAFYSDRGFPEARVTNFDVTLNQKQNAVDVVISVDEGEPVIVKKLVFEGFGLIPPNHLKTLTQSSPVRVDRPRDQQLVLSARDMSLNELQDHGYPYATVRVDEDDGATGKEASLTIVGEPGKLARFGDTEIQGQTRVSEKVIRRALTLTPGDLYRRSEVQNNQRRLYATSLFQYVNVEPIHLDQQPDEVPMRVTVAEGPHQRVNLSAGYGTEEQVRVDTQYRRLDFLGGGRSAGIHARWSALDRGVQADFTQPYFLDPHITLSLQAQDWLTFTPAYRSTETGATVTGTYQIRQRLSLSLSASALQSTSAVAPSILADPELRNALIALGLNPQTGEQSGSINAVRADLRQSTVGNVLNPRRGYQLAFSIEQAGRIIPGTFQYTAVAGDARHYLPLGDRIVWANRLQIANIAPATNNPLAVPFSKKLFLGGATSIRGWGRYEVSPLTDDGLPIGGNSSLAFSSEMRAPIRGSVGVVGFLDGGNVWARSWVIQADELRYAVGAGIRYETPIGPLRLDYGYQLNPIPGLVVEGEPQTRRWRVHFSIGQAF